MPVNSQGIITGPSAAFDCLEGLKAHRVKSWDNNTSPKVQDSCRKALRDAGFYCESVYKGKDNAKDIYGLYLYRNHEERIACFALHANPLAGMYHYRL